MTIEERADAYIGHLKEIDEFTINIPRKPTTLVVG